MQEKHGTEGKTVWREAHYQAADINDRLIINLRDLSHTLRSLYEGRGSQKRILIVLAEMGGSVTQRQLTRRLGIRSGSASEVIGKLESGGCVRRTVNEADRRNVDVVLTEKGKALAEEAKRGRDLRHEQMFCCLSAEEKAELLALLEKVGADWEERFGGPKERGPSGRRGEQEE